MFHLCYPAQNTVEDDCCILGFRMRNVVHQVKEMKERHGDWAKHIVSAKIHQLIWTCGHAILAGMEHWPIHIQF